MLYSEEFLHKIVVKKTSIIDRTIKEKEEIVKLKSNKFAYGSLICNIYGHKPVRNETDENICYCENCGRLVNMGLSQIGYEKVLQNKKVYKEKCNNESIKRR